MSLPSAVSELLSSAPAVGFSGSRSVVPAACAEVVPAVSSPVFVGCARGVDAAFRAAFPSARVFSAASFGSGRGSFAARSSALVRALHLSGGVLVSFPSPGSFPSGLVPSPSSSRCFSGLGSGSWATLALAVGLGVPCAVFLGSGSVPAGFSVPSVWCARSVGGGWWVCQPRAVQLSLF
jgi:hypothetical protein